MANQQVTVKISSSVTALGPYNVYKTSISEDNLLEANVSLASLKTGRIYRIDTSITQIMIKNVDPNCCCSVNKIIIGDPEPTPSPTTAAPTTAAPTTSAPTTAAPTTAAPTTAAPTTSSPTTASPTTASPTTAAPTTASPTTSSPPTASPTTAAPTTAAPTTASPTTSSPTTAAPTTAAPTTVAPTSTCQNIFLYSTGTVSACSIAGDLSIFETDNALNPTIIYVGGSGCMTPLAGGNLWYTTTIPGTSYQVNNSGNVINSSSCP